MDLEAIEKRLNTLRGRSIGMQLMLDPVVKVLTQQDIPALMEALKSSRERERVLVAAAGDVVRVFVGATTLTDGNLYAEQNKRMVALAALVGMGVTVQAVRRDTQSADGKGRDGE